MWIKKAYDFTALERILLLYYALEFFRFFFLISLILRLSFPFLFRLIRKDIVKCYPRAATCALLNLSCTPLSLLLSIQCICQSGYACLILWESVRPNPLTQVATFPTCVREYPVLDPKSSTPGFLGFLQKFHMCYEIVLQIRVTTQPLPEMSTRNINIIMFLGRPLRRVPKTDNLTAIYVPIV
jgi:hypothetical protein